VRKLSPPPHTIRRSLLGGLQHLRCSARLVRLVAVVFVIVIVIGIVIVIVFNASRAHDTPVWQPRSREISSVVKKRRMRSARSRRQIHLEHP
jgi:hypothetical protein